MKVRKLAAIMFSDIVGYTALMGSDEDKAFDVLRKNRQIHLRFIDQFDGTLIKEMGDGMMDEILNHLFQIGDLQVISRTSVMQYKGTTKTIP